MGDLEGSAVALLELPLVSKVVRAFQWQFVHFCNIICSVLFGCMFCLVALSGQFPRILAHRLSLR